MPVAPVACPPGARVVPGGDPRLDIPRRRPPALWIQEDPGLDPDHRMALASDCRGRQRRPRRAVGRRLRAVAPQHPLHCRVEAAVAQPVPRRSTPGGSVSSSSTTASSATSTSNLMGAPPARPRSVEVGVEGGGPAVTRTRICAAWISAFWRRFGRSWPSTQAAAAALTVAPAGSGCLRRARQPGGRPLGGAGRGDRPRRRS